MKVILETFVMKVFPETYLMKVILETYPMKVILETYLIGPKHNIQNLLRLHMSEGGKPIM
jgi:hypothetical protein